MAKQLKNVLENTKLPIRILHEPDAGESKKISFFLDVYTKNDLMTMAEPLLKLMRKCRFRFDCGNGKTKIPPIIALFEQSNTRIKAEWVSLLTLFYDAQNYMMLLEDRPKCEIELYREVLRNHYLIDTEVEKIMNIQCLKRSNFYYGREALVEPLRYYFNVINKKSVLDKRHSWRKTSDFIFTDDLLQQMLFKGLFPDLATINGLDNLPDASALLRYNGENLIFSKLPVMASAYDSKLLPHQLGKLTAAVVKKVQKLLALPEYFKTDTNNKQACLSANHLLNYYVFYRQYMGRKNLPANPELLLKDIYNETFVQNSVNVYTLPVLLPYLKGLKKNKINVYSFAYVISVLLSLLKDHHAKTWLRVDQLIMNIRSKEYRSDKYFVLIDPYSLDDMDIRNGYIEDKDKDCYIHPGNIVKQMSEPLVKALLFTLSTLGVVEIAYREPQEGDTSPYDGLRYVRVTGLGKFVFGLTDSYEPQSTEEDKQAFELDDQRLLIRVRNMESPFIQFLADYGDNIAPSLYCVSYESFLRNCSTRFDVERKVKMFRQFICKKLPQVWKQFMDDVVKRCNPFGVPQDDYMILTLPKDNTDLQRLVLTHPSIRRYILKAENYMVLVKESDLNKLKNEIKKFGYLI